PFDLHGPDAITLGVDRSAEITFRAPARAQPIARVNVGHLSPPQKGPEGTWHATYTPPEERFPQVAIIAVADQEEGAVDLLAIPLHGQAQIDAETEPNARVEVRVGDASFGPVRADSRGHARFVVITPPGTRTGRTVAVDAVGNAVEKPLDL